MDSARCQCPVDSQGTKCGRNMDCPIHGFTSADPRIPWYLNENDRKMLKSFRIGEPEDIEAIRKLDEGRFNPPRNG